MPIDMLQDEEGDILLKDGDVVWGESTTQHQRDILLVRPGDFKVSPRGVGLGDYIDDEDPEEMLRNARKQFVKDGMTVQKLTVNEIIARY